MPDFMLVGAAKSATTSIANILTSTEKVFIPEFKEPSYFSQDQIAKDLINKNPKKYRYIANSLNNYAKLYQDVNENKTLGDASTAYLYFHKTAVKEIKQVYSTKAEDIRIIISLRNPILRAFSQYKYNMQRGLEPLTFIKACETKPSGRRLTPNRGLDYIGYGMYYSQVKAYIDNFKNVKVFLFDDFKNNPVKLFESIFEFLGIKIDKKEINQLDFQQKSNPSGRPKSKFAVTLFQNQSLIKDLLRKVLPQKTVSTLRASKYRVMGTFLEEVKLSNKDKKYLESKYKYEILRLEKLLDRDLSFWLNN